MKPQLFISDICVIATTKADIDVSKMTMKDRDKLAKKRDGKGEVKRQEFRQTLRMYPCLMSDGKFPSEAYQRRFIERNFSEIPKGNFDIRVEFSNTRFSSSILYEFKD
jgi:hypothetical protein